MSDRVPLLGVDEAREEQGVLDEKDGRVVADQVPDPLFGVEFNRETAGIPGDKNKNKNYSESKRPRGASLWRRSKCSVSRQ